MDETERTTRGTTILTGQTLFAGVARMVNLAILARLLLQVEMGQIAILAIVFGFMQFFGALGLNYASPLFVSEYEEKKSMGKIKGFLFKSIFLILLLSFCLVLIVPSIFDIAFGWAGIATTLVFLVVIIGPLSSLEVFLDSFLLARYDFTRLTLGRIIFDVTRLSLTVFFVLNGFGVAGVLTGWLLSEGAAVVIYSGFAMRGLKIPYEAVAIVPIITFSIPNLIFQTIDVAIQSIDRSVLGFFVGVDSLGVFDVILRVLLVFSLLSISISTSLFPFMTRQRVRLETSQNYYSGMTDMVHKLVRYVLIVLSPLAIISAINSRSILWLLFGSNYADYPDASISFSLLLLTYTLWGIVYSIHTVLRSMSEARFFLVAGALIIVIEITIGWFLIPLFGLFGAALTRTLYVLILFVITYIKIRRLGILRLISLIPSVVRIATASIIAGLLVFLISPIGLLSMGFWLVVAMVSYFILLFVLKEVTEFDFKLASSILPSIFQSLLARIKTRYFSYKQKELIEDSSIPES